MPKLERYVPRDGCDAMYAGFSLEDNPFLEWEDNFDKWDKEFLEAAKNYREEGRFRNNSFKG